MADALELGGSKGRTISVRVVANGRKRTFEVPLRGSLKIADVMLFRPPRDLKEEDQADWGFDAFYGFICRYVPQEVINELSQEDYEALYKAWDEQSDAEDVSQGE